MHVAITSAIEAVPNGHKMKHPKLSEETCQLIHQRDMVKRICKKSVEEKWKQDMHRGAL